MNLWNTHKPIYRIMAFTLVFVLVLSTLTSCTKAPASGNASQQTEVTAGDNWDKTINTDSEPASVMQETVNQNIRTVGEMLTEAVQAEDTALEMLTEAVTENRKDDAWNALSELRECKAEADNRTAEWLSVQEQAIADRLSEQTEVLLFERTAILKQEIADKEAKAEDAINALEQVLNVGNQTKAEAGLTRLQEQLRPVSESQIYGIRNHEMLTLGTGKNTLGADASVPPLDTEVDIEIMELADELGTPLEVYTYLKNTIQYENYYGSRKGAKGTYASSGGNDYDQASLLIGMLRYLGYEAEYVRGTIQLKEDQVLSLTGADNLEHAADVLAAAGTPVTKITKNGVIVSIQTEHVWVRALLPYTDYRGAGNATGDPIWIDLDTSIKAYENVENIYDVAQKTGIPEGLAEAVASNNAEALQSVLDNYAETIAAMDLSQTYVRKRIIKQEEISYLPLSLQYEVKKEMETFQEIPASEKDCIQFAVAGEVLGTYSAAELAGASVILAYLPATPEDAELLNAYNTILDVPASYIYVRPVLMIDGRIAAKAEDVSVTLGTAHEFTIRLQYDRGKTERIITNTIGAGSIYAITIDTQIITEDTLRNIYNQVMAKQDSATVHNIFTPEYMGAYLSLAGKLYFAEADLCYMEAGEIYGICATRKLSEGITGYEFGKEGRYGIVTNLTPGSLYIDIDADDHAVRSLTGNKEEERAYLISAGILSSLYESIVWEQLTGHKSVSTIAIFQEAQRQGIELLTITQKNREEQFKRLNVDEGTKQTIHEAINSGNTVAIPIEPVTIGEWTGTGYVLLDESTGAGSYMISGGLNGGEVPFSLAAEVMLATFFSATGAALLINVLSLSILAVMYPVGIYVVYASIIALVAIMIVDMYCSYYDYILTGDMEAYMRTEDMALLLYLVAELELVAAQTVFAYMVIPFLGKGDSDIIPEKARNMAQQIKNNNGTPLPGYKGGKIYQNNPVNGGQKLPEGVNYREYDIDPYVKGQGRGAERIVIGDDDSVWYTNDHYYTFHRME